MKIHPSSVKYYPLTIRVVAKESRNYNLSQETLRLASDIYENGVCYGDPLFVFCAQYNENVIKVKRAQVNRGACLQSGLFREERIYKDLRLSEIARDIKNKICDEYQIPEKEQSCILVY